MTEARFAMVLRRRYQLSPAQWNDAVAGYLALLNEEARDLINSFGAAL